MPRGNGRGRGNRGGGDVGNRRGGRAGTTVHDRLGRIPVFPNNRRATDPYKYQKNQSSSSIITNQVAPIPQDSNLKKMARRFLRNYYNLFDSPGRSELETLYSSDAFFSFSTTHPISSTFGRNLLQVRDHTERISLLVHDKTNIARFLATFLPTQHLVNNLIVDIPYYIINPLSIVSMQLIVNGVFRDTSDTTNPLKAFTRVFVLKQTSVDEQGDPTYIIFNDLFMIQPPTPDQIKQYHHELKIAKTVRPAQASSGAAASDSKDAMILNIMQKTKMNHAGSKQLLEDLNWNETEAMERFKGLMAVNQIPQHLFAP